VKDRVLLEILSNRFMGIARELGHIIKTAGHTVFVKETADFGAYLVSPRGEVFMTPDDMGIFITIGTPMDGAIEATSRATSASPTIPRARAGWSRTCPTTSCGSRCSRTDA
jgi:N-methylhydantoinase B/oxoprolinase/acetone carboxylase alpha subunit